jgi:hypothetical protein
MFDLAAAACNASVLSTMGRTVTVSVGGVETVLTGVYTAPFASGIDQGTSYQRPDHSVLFLSDEFADTGAAEGDLVSIGDRDFYIADIAVDDGGMTNVTLRAT